MFKKPVKIQSSNKLKKAIFKKVRQQVSESLPKTDELSAEELGVVFPTRLGGFEVTKLKGIRASYYTYNNLPVYIDIDSKGNIIPTVFGLWREPRQLLVFEVDDGAAAGVLNGAEFMAPGLYHKNIADLPEFEADQHVALALPNSKVIAVGTTVVGSADLKKTGLRGKMIHIEHYIGDHFFILAWETSSSPYCNFPPELEHLADKIPLPVRATIVADASENAPDAASEQPESTNSDHSAQKEGEPSNQKSATTTTTTTEREGDGEEKDSDDKHTEEHSGDDSAPQHKDQDTDDHAPARTHISMDELLKFSFLQAIKFSVKPEDLPVVGSVFYSLYIQPNRPKGTKIELKQTSYKKLTKFLQAMAREEFIEIKPMPKGEVQIQSINQANAQLVAFQGFATEANPDSKTSTSQPKSKETHDSEHDADKSLKIVRMLKASPELFVVFTTVDENAKKDTFYSRKEVIQILWEYTKKLELDDPTNKARVKLDQVLARAAYRKQKAEGDIVTREDLSPRFVDALQEYCEVSRDGVTNLVKGKLEPIVSKEERRGGKKYVTKVRGLETFNISPKEVAKDLRKRFSASSTVNDIPGTKSKNGTPLQEVIVQGNLNAKVKDYLTETYNIPTKLISLVAAGK